MNAGIVQSTFAGVIDDGARLIEDSPPRGIWHAAPHWCVYSESMWMNWFGLYARVRWRHCCISLRKYRGERRGL